jgi:hypothetical protein
MHYYKEVEEPFIDIQTTSCLLLVCALRQLYFLLEPLM